MPRALDFVFHWFGELLIVGLTGRINSLTQCGELLLASPFDRRDHFTLAVVAHKNALSYKSLK
jgi:hypothetical protein